MREVKGVPSGFSVVLRRVWELFSFFFRGFLCSLKGGSFIEVNGVSTDSGWFQECFLGVSGVFQAGMASYFRAVSRSFWKPSGVVSGVIRRVSEVQRGPSEKIGFKSQISVNIEFFGEYS